MYDVIIIGSGPAGLTAGIYCSRSGLNTLIIGECPGGQVSNIHAIENYPGYDNVSGYDLITNFYNQAKSFGAKFLTETVTAIDNYCGTRRVRTKSGIYECKSIIIATGRHYKRLDIPGECQFYGNGVSYCGTCDGPLYKNKDIAVIGGGNTALQEALYLSNFAKSITLIHRRYTFRADDILIKKVRMNPKISLVMNTIPMNICGDDCVNMLSALEIDKNNQSVIHNFAVDGVFIFVGQEPNTSFCRDTVALDMDNYIECIDNSLKTSSPGIFVAGDTRKKTTYQIVTAAGDGALAAMNVYEYLNS